jgi:hypothetical protein
MWPPPGGAFLGARLAYHDGIVYDTASNDLVAQAILSTNDHDEGERYGRSNRPV